ncbi:hypothetical protein [Seonamhaeicola sp.]|uniref:hypothetical protein n=1 Tax=Seonamhaeicola sp. TaxID=1912245 RepID=UPI00262DE3B3|nr:hypothetical protein [Seonamhaeicola sp.]
MKTNYLLPHRYKLLGWLLFIPGIIAGLFLFFNDYETSILNVKVLSIFYEGIFDSETGFFRIVNNQILDEITALAIIIGGLLITLTKEKIEDEFIYKLRKDSLVWAIIFNYIILLLTILFIYDMAFFHVLVLNMFTPLLFFIIRFNFLKQKLKSDEE